MLTSIEGKSVVVTGASKGIGKGIAGVFASKGAKVLVVARNADAGNQAVAEFQAAGGTAAFCQGDVTSWESMRAMAQTAVDTHGGIDILCANAGIFPNVQLTEMSSEDWDEVLGTNLKGTFLSVKACLPHLPKGGGGRIVLTSSITGPITGDPGWTHYGASKSGQLGFMRTAAIELAPHKITINAVMPGNIATEGLDGLGQDYLDKMIESIPLKKLGSVEDIAYAALFFASEEAGFITGQTMVIDGGQVLPESLGAIL
jgi:3-oxoacyl-[acyl-carrier protein] reductase